MIHILRGIPGSGKSTWVRNLCDNTPKHEGEPLVCSADDFRYVDGEYVFNKENPGEAHQKCFLKFMEYLAFQDKNGQFGDIIVDNTNTSAFEIAPYALAAAAHQREFEIVDFQIDLATAVARNTHEVPYGTICMMYRNMVMEVLPAFWPRTLGG